MLLDIRTFCFRVSPQTFYFDVFLVAKFVDSGLRWIIGVDQMFDVTIDPSSDVSEHAKPSIIVILIFLLPDSPCTIGNC